MRITSWKFLVLFVVTLAWMAGCGPANQHPAPLPPHEPVRGWNILSSNVEEGLLVIDEASNYDINHLQLSHEIIHDLRHVRDSSRLSVARELAAAAHERGIQEVVVWDRALYELDYYPNQFRTGPDGTIDLDNPEFWEWFKTDYRAMLDEIPEIQGIIFTFIETGARVERQHSEKLKSNQEKLAALVNVVADIVIEERGLNLYARTFSYTYEEYDNIVGAIDLFENDQIRLMMKETPHDFFLTHPNKPLPGTIARPTLMEFDTGAEFNGQGIIANTWPEYILSRWSDYFHREHVIGYVARTDRYGDTRIVGRPSEINLYALKRYAADQSITADEIYKEFIVANYGEEAFPHVKKAFQSAFDIVTSTLYTLGISTANHSMLNYDPYPSHWARHVSGKWIDPPVVFVKHGVNKEFHYWKDVVNTLAPDWAKAGGTQLREIPWVIDSNWLHRGELMNEAYLRDIIQEKEYGENLAAESLAQIIAARDYVTDEQYHELYHCFNRTLITARLHKHVAAMYFGFRIYARGREYQTPYLTETITTSLAAVREIADEINSYPVHTQIGQWNWNQDAEMAMQYVRWITEGTWPAKAGRYDTNLDGKRFPID